MCSAPHRNTFSADLDLVKADPQLLQVSELARPVGVDHQDAFSTTMQDAVLDRASLAPIPRERHDAYVDLRILFRELQCGGGRGVLGAVVHDDDLERALGRCGEGGKVCYGRCEHGLQA